LASLLGPGRRTSSSGSRLITRRVVWTEEARANLSAIRSYIADFSPLAAGRLAERLVAAAETLATHPHTGRRVRGDLRELTIISPYIVRYRVTDTTVLILRVRHGARRG
jgi:addiction module RelE/StbE family toxin